jgi:hypothetical protein
MPDSNTMPSPTDILHQFSEALTANTAGWDREQRENLTYRVLERLARLHSEYEAPDDEPVWLHDRDQEIGALLRATAKVIWNQTWYALADRTRERERLRALLDHDPAADRERDRAVADRLSESRDGAE